MAKDKWKKQVKSGIVTIAIILSLLVLLVVLNMLSAPTEEQAAVEEPAEEAVSETPQVIGEAAQVAGELSPEEQVELPREETAAGPPFPAESGAAPSEGNAGSVE